MTSGTHTYTQTGAGTVTTVTDTSTVDIAGTKVATVNVTSTGSANTVGLTNTGAALKTLNIAGDKNLTISSSIDFEGTAGSIDASKLQADLTFSAATSNDAVKFFGAAGKNSITTGSGNDELTGQHSDDTLNAGTGNDIVKAAAGNDTITVGAGSVNVDAGEGNDTILVSGLDKSDVIDGGTGTDVLGLTFADADAADAATTAGGELRATWKGVDVLRVTDTISGALNIGTLGFNSLQIDADVSDGGAGASVAVTGFTNGGTVEYRTNANMTDALAIGLKDAALTTDDAINIKLNADVAHAAALATKFTVNGINVVNVNAVDRVDSTTATDDNGADDGYSIALTDAANMNALNISGTAAVSFTLDAGAAAIKTIDASTSTGNVTINVSAFAGTERVTIKGSQGVNTITGDDAAFGEAIIGGAKGDSITAGAGADSITGGAGRDAFINVDGDSTLASLDKIADFGKASIAVLAADNDLMNAVSDFQATATAKGGDNADVLDIGTTAAALSAAVSTPVDVAAASGDATKDIKAVLSAKGIVTLSGADKGLIDTLAEFVAVVQTAGLGVTTAGEVAAFEFGGNTYVFQEVGATDQLIELTGVTGFTSSTGIVITGSNTAVAVGDIFVL